ncbi:hypothetical protein FQN49_006883 [Arthroderma sp. PD_2]|nr:hypothetical protein FQN49_006883 [Arthroderma sp. PD_2]
MILVGEVITWAVIYAYQALQSPRAKAKEEPLADIEAALQKRYSAVQTGEQREKLQTELLQPTPMIYDDAQHVFGNEAGVDLINDVRGLRAEHGSIQQRIDDTVARAVQDLGRKLREENEAEKQRLTERFEVEMQGLNERFEAEMQGQRAAYRATLSEMMTLRVPVYASVPGSQVSAGYRAKRNVVAQGGAVMMDLSILQFLGKEAAAFPKWADGFVKIYWLQPHYAENLTDNSKMVSILNIYADASLLDAYADHAHKDSIKEQCTTLMKLWKGAHNSDHDPNVIFNRRDVNDKYDAIVKLFSSVG